MLSCSYKSFCLKESVVPLTLSDTFSLESHFCYTGGTGNLSQHQLINYFALMALGKGGGGAQVKSER